MEHVLEMVMMICFGASWPLNIYKLWRAKTIKGSSVVFYCLIVLGYIAGIISKVIQVAQGDTFPWYIWFFYILNASMVSTGVVIWFRNRQFDRRAEKI